MLPVPPGDGITKPPMCFHCGLPERSSNTLWTMPCTRPVHAICRLPHWISCGQCQEAPSAVESLADLEILCQPCDKTFEDKVATTAPPWREGLCCQPNCGERPEARCFLQECGHLACKHHMVYLSNPTFEDGTTAQTEEVPVCFCHVEVEDGQAWIGSDKQQRRSTSDCLLYTSPSPRD